MKTSPRLLFGAIALTFFMVLPRAEAVSISVTNAGFEDISGQTVFNEFTLETPNGWSIHDPAGIVPDPNVYVGTLQPNGVDFFPVTAPEGNRVAILFNSGRKAEGEYGYVQQLSTMLQANTLYTLTVQVGNITSGTAQDNTFYNLSNFPGYRVDLMAGGNVLASDNNTLTIAEGAWALSTVTFTTGNSVLPSQALGIRLVSLNATNAVPDNEVDFDQVQLDALAVPEPGSLILLGGGFIALALRRRR